jgi:DNA-binding MarR family transcriptional regulator
LFVKTNDSRAAGLVCDIVSSAETPMNRKADRTSSSRDVLAVLRLYPRIYHACHLRHERAASSTYALSERDVAILGHLDDQVPMTLGALADHVGVLRSTMSEAVADLEDLGYLIRTRGAKDKRQLELRLSPKGADALLAGSVLDMERVRQLLSRMLPRDRRSAITGLELLAAATRTMSRKEWR